MKTIQKTILAALCCTMAFNVQAQERTFQRNKVLVEKHTGQDCSACPSADNILIQHLGNTNNFENVVIMRHYNYPYEASLRMPFHTNLSNVWGFDAWPKLQVDRASFVQSATDRSQRESHYFDASRLNSYNAVTTRVQIPTYVSLSLEGSTYDSATKKLRVTLSGEVTKTLPYLRVNVFLTQSGIPAYQSGQTNYIHDDVSFDYLMNDVLGDALTLNPDGTYSVTFEKTLPEKFKAIPTIEKNIKVVAFINSHYNVEASYYEQDFSTCEVHNADVISLLDLPATATCAAPSITFQEGEFVCKSTTPNATCHCEILPCMKPSDRGEGVIDLEAPAFTVTAYAEATGFSRSVKVKRTFTLRDILAGGTTDVFDVNGDGRINKDDVDSLLSRLLKKVR